jgi:hypothetical protein
MVNPDFTITLRAFPKMCITMNISGMPVNQSVTHLYEKVGATGAKNQHVRGRFFWGFSSLYCRC